MNIRNNLLTSAVLVAGLATILVSGAAQAALQGRDLNGSPGSFEAYYDTVLDITWLANANLGAGSIYDNGFSTTDGRMTWANANAWAASLSFTDGVNVYDNWRLPTVDPIGVSFNITFSNDGSTDMGYGNTSPNAELSYMYYVNLGLKPGRNPDGTERSDWGIFGNGTFNGLNLESYGQNNVGPISNLQAYVYWSGTERTPEQAWVFGTSGGIQSSGFKIIDYNAWAVSDGDVAAVPEAETYALMLSGLGLIGWRLRRRG